MAVARRVVLGWLAGLSGWLLVDTADAKPRRRTGIYTDLYSDEY